MFDIEKVPAYLRTVVPVLWGSLLAWLAVQIPAIPDAWEEWLGSDQGVALVSAAVITLWYAFWRWLEPKLSPFLTRLLLGSNLTPVYVDPGTPPKDEAIEAAEEEVVEVDDVEDTDVDGTEPDLEEIDGATFDEAAEPAPEVEEVVDTPPVVEEVIDTPPADGEVHPVPPKTPWV
jgi:hypothetical protein